MSYEYRIILTDTTFPFEIHFLIFIEIGFLHFFQHWFNILVKSCLIHRRMGEFWARTHFFKIWSYRNYLFLLSVRRLLEKGDKIWNVRLTLYVISLLTLMNTMGSKAFLGSIWHFSVTSISRNLQTDWFKFWEGKYPVKS